MESWHLIVGLGNPGAEYARTRHNAGFQVTARLAERRAAPWSDEAKFRARVARFNLGEHSVLLAQPVTFMNVSGESVGALVRFYRLPLTAVLVVVDDADLPLGEIRMRAGGSSGGHHGLESIEQHLGSREYPRSRVGIGRTDGRREITGHVLGRFNAEEHKRLEDVLGRAADQAECWVQDGIEKAMNRFNGVVNSNEKKA
jgi:PTH1 family peptidyl-tRNA hydrolase